MTCLKKIFMPQVTESLVYVIVDCVFLSCIVNAACVTLTLTGLALRSCWVAWFWSSVALAVSQSHYGPSCLGWGVVGGEQGDCPGSHHHLHQKLLGQQL